MSLDKDYLALVEEIEERFPVDAWRAGDVAIWPLARLDLYLDLYWQRHGDRGGKGPGKMARTAELLARPLANPWRQRRDLSRLLLRARQADVILLGDGVSAEKIDGAWEDRYGEPVLALLESEGQSCFQMQAGDMRRAPWRRPTFPANLVEAAGQALAPLFQTPLDLPDHAPLMHLLNRLGVQAPSLSPARLARRAAVLRATAWLFERILDTVQPRLAFAVTWYAGLGPAFLLACRRQGILSVDLQHCPQRNGHKAYRWSRLPEGGFALLPAVFWTWDDAEAAHIRAWASGPWHRALPGGHLRRDPFLSTPQLPGEDGIEREILVALQTLQGREPLWNDLADTIERAPPGWRWWIRRHPAARPEDDARFGRLLFLRGDNIVMDGASAQPLPALLGRMSAVLSVSSGVGPVAAPFGVPALALGDDPRSLIAQIAALPRHPERPALERLPDPDFALSLLSGLAADYARLCAERPAGPRRKR